MRAQLDLLRSGLALYVPDGQNDIAPPGYQLVVEVSSPIWVDETTGRVVQDGRKASLCSVQIVYPVRVADYPSLEQARAMRHVSSVELASENVRNFNSLPRDVRKQRYERHRAVMETAESGGRARSLKERAKSLQREALPAGIEVLLPDYVAVLSRAFRRR